MCLCVCVCADSHNVHHYSRFFQAIRSAIADSTFAQYKSKFLAAYGTSEDDLLAILRREGKDLPVGVVSASSTGTSERLAAAACGGGDADEVVNSNEPKYDQLLTTFKDNAAGFGETKKAKSANATHVYTAAADSKITYKGINIPVSNKDKHRFKRKNFTGDERGEEERKEEAR